MKQQQTQNKIPENNRSVVIFWIASIGTAIFISIAFLYWTVVPYMQSSEYISDIRQSSGTGDISILLNDDFIFSLNTNVQGILRNDFLRMVITQYDQGGLTAANPLLDKAILQMQNYTDTHANYYSYILSLANGYAIQSQLTNNPKLFDTSISYYNKDLSIIKDRQDVMYSYAIDLAQHGKEQEAQALIQSEIDKYPDVYATHYQLGSVFMLFRSPDFKASLAQFEMALDHNIDLNGTYTKQSYERFLSYFYEKNDFQDFYTVISRLKKLDPNQKYIYQGVLDYMDSHKEIPVLNITPAK